MSHGHLAHASEPESEALSGEQNSTAEWARESEGSRQKCEHLPGRGCIVKPEPGRVSRVNIPPQAVLRTRARSRTCPLFYVR
jgi:hypothetical protein